MTNHQAPARAGSHKRRGLETPYFAMVKGELPYVPGMSR